MAYIGNAPAQGEFKRLDPIAASFNGSLNSFNLLFNSVSQSVGDASQIIVSLNGVIQEPLAAYTLSVGGGAIVFASAPASTDTCHIVSLGNAGGGTATPSDGSVTAVKLAANLKELLEEEFTANGSATTFTMARSVATSNMLMVTVDGIVQPTSAYSVSGTTLTISPALPNTTNIRILHIGISGAGIAAGAVTTTMISAVGGTANQVLAVNSGGSAIEFQTASGGGSGVAIQDEGSSLGTAATTLNFVGSGVSATGSGASKTITISSGGSALTIQEEGSSLSTAATTMNFVGSGVTATGSGATKTITISAGGGSALTVQEEGSSLSTAATTLNFVGSSVTATGSGATKTITIASGGLSDVVSDTTPQLGGTLDANSNTIDMGTNILTDANLGQFITAHGWGNHASGGYQTTSGLNAAIDTHVNQSNPTSGHVLSWNGSDYAWVANTGSGGIASLVADTSPQLGGTLDANGNTIDMGTNVLTDANLGQFITAHGWGNHASASYLTSVPAQTFASLTSKPTTISGYGITDALALGTSSTTALAGNTSLLALGTSSTTALAGNTTLFNGAFASLTSKPTTISGYGITDAATEFGLPADQSFTVVNSGSSAYTIGGGASGNNAALTLIRGRTYKFAVNASGHPFRINTSNTTGTGAAYVNGTAVINNGAAVGDIYFTVPDTAPDTLYYNCQHHSGMAGTINVSNALRIDKATGNLFVNTTDVDLGYTDGESGMVLRNDGVFQVARDESGSNNGVLYVNKLNGEGKSIILYNEAVQKGYIGTNGAYLYMGAGDTSLRFHAGADAILPAAETGASRSGAIDLGTSGALFKDLYLSGGIHLGGTGTANKLDDYEEGTFTPLILNGWGILNPTYSTNAGFYTKVGNMVHVAFRITLSGGSTNANGLRLTQLPFTVGATTSVGTNLSGWFATASSNATNVFLGLEAGDLHPLFYYQNATGTSTFLGTDAGTGFSMTFSGTYQTT